jgi:hypothetical protein
MAEITESIKDGNQLDFAREQVTIFNGEEELAIGTDNVSEIPQSFILVTDLDDNTNMKTRSFLIMR